MTAGPKTTQLILAGVVAAALGGAALLHEPLEEQSKAYDLSRPGDTTVVASPLQTLLTLAPGGLRAPIVSFLWMRAEELKEKGRFHEMRDLSEWICRFMPRYPGVWDYHAWNMVWNVSVTAHSGDERWRWLESGINLLRDRGIALNPRSLGLYKELGWIYYEKLGQGTDEMHYVYKQRWAERMQDLLAAPVFGTTDEVIDAFRPIAAAPLDRDPYRPREGSFRGNHHRLGGDELRRWDGRDSSIQRDQLKVLLAGNADVRALADDLAALGLRIDESLLAAYNRFSRDEAMEAVRARPLGPPAEADRAIAALINDPARAAARTAALAFVRAQVLWNAYRLDPAWMLGVMERYNVPLDWRQAPAHAIYWITLGQDRCKQIIGAEDSLNIDRTLLYSLRDLTFYGRMTYIENPDERRSPTIRRFPDWRFIEPAHQAHVDLGKIAIHFEDDLHAARRVFDQNKYRTGHINFLSECIEMLYRAGRVDRAQALYDWIKDNYAPEGDLWKLPLKDYVVEDIRRDGRPIPSLARTQIRGSLIAAYEALPIRTEAAQNKYRMLMRYALRVHAVFNPETSQRYKLPSMKVLAADTVAAMLVRPRMMGRYLSLPYRHRLYTALDADIRRMIYDRIAPSLKRQCAQANPPLDFTKAFPEPPGMAAYREHLRRTRRTQSDKTVEDPS